MSGSSSRPWWASDGPVDGTAGDEDPVEAFRAARRGQRAHGAADEVEDDADGAGPWQGERWLGGVATTVSRLARDFAETAEAHRAAGAAGPDGPAPADGQGDAGGDGFGAAGGHATGGEADHRFDTCGVCPVCAGLRALADANPELVDHLAEAARHVALAARALVDQRPRRGEGRDEPLEHIDLD